MNATTPAPTTTSSPAPKGKASKGKPAKKGKKPKKEAPPVNPHGNRGTPTAAPVKVNARPAKGVAVTTAGQKGVATRASVHGASVTSVLRQLAAFAYPAFTVAHAETLVGKLGVPLRPNCLKAQVGSGRQGGANKLAPEAYRYGPPAKLGSAEVKALLKLAGV